MLSGRGPLRVIFDRLNVALRYPVSPGLCISGWRVTGAVAPGQDPPYRLSRDVIEAAIKKSGFQLFRMSKKD